MTFTTADLLKFGLAKTRKAVRVGAVEPTSQAGGFSLQLSEKSARELVSCRLCYASTAAANSALSRARAAAPQQTTQQLHKQTAAMSAAATRRIGARCA